MFDFVDEIDELKSVTFDYRYYNYGGKVVVIQGYKDIILFDENLVTLKLKYGAINVYGENLCVREYSPNLVKICGFIKNVEVEGK